MFIWSWFLDFWITPGSAHEGTYGVPGIETMLAMCFICCTITWAKHKFFRYKDLGGNITRNITFVQLIITFDKKAAVTKRLDGEI